MAVIIGTTGNDVLVGGIDNDTLSGGPGSDLLQGGAGSDTYVFGPGYGVDTIVDQGGADTDVLQLGAGITADQVTLIRNPGPFGDLIVQVNGTADAVRVAGQFIGDGSGIEQIKFADGTVWGAAQINAAGYNLVGTAGNDVLTGGIGADTLSGGLGSDVLVGADGNDSIAGDGGNDTLVGGGGKDSLTGGAGRDIFDFDAIGDSGPSSTDWDVINDFVRGQDKIDLRSIDANSATTGDEAFKGLINAAKDFTLAGQLKFSGGVLYGNTDTDAEAEFAIQVNGVAGLSNSDFLL